MIIRAIDDRNYWDPYDPWAMLTWILDWPNPFEEDAREPNDEPEHQG